MEQYVGLDVSLKETSICVLDGSGETVWQGEVSTSVETLARSIRRKAPHAVRRSNLPRERTYAQPAAFRL